MRGYGLATPLTRHRARVDFIPNTRMTCLRCQRPTHPDEMIYHALLKWACLRCVEDTRVGRE